MGVIAEDHIHQDLQGGGQRRSQAPLRADVVQQRHGHIGVELLALALIQRLAKLWVAGLAWQRQMAHVFQNLGPGIKAQAALVIEKLEILLRGQ